MITSMTLRRMALFLIMPSLLLGVLVMSEGRDFAQEESCDPGFPVSDWSLTDFCKHGVDYEEIISGGVRKDGIPALDQPKMESVAQAAEWLNPQSPVIAVEIDGQARAYPQALLIWHEIANDELAGVPITITFCPLCNSSIVFDGRVGDEILSFGVSGRLRNSDMIMYDRQTESWWQQFTGEGIVGQYTDTLLEIIPSRVMGFGQFQALYPDGLVMTRDTGYSRDYGSNPYYAYDSNAQPFLFMGELDSRLFPVERVLAGEIDGQAIAYPFTRLAEEKVINDQIGDQAVVAFWQTGVASALDASQIDASVDIGTAGLYQRELDGINLNFEIDADGRIMDQETGSEWNGFGMAIAGELAGEQLEILTFAPHFWFAWAAFQPDTLIYGQE